MTLTLLPRYDDRQRAAAEEAFAVQYVPNTHETPDEHDDDILFGIDNVGGDEAGTGSGAGAGAGSGGGASSGGRRVRVHPTASLTIRYLGKPIIAGAAGGAGPTVKGFQYAPSLPAYLSRMVAPSRILLGDESAEIEEEDPSAAAKTKGADGEDELVLGPYGLPLPPPRQTPLLA